MQSTKRSACNECRQQKLRCDLATTDASSCSRCRKLGLECKLEPSFQRLRKRRRTTDLEEEILHLQTRLQEAENAVSQPAVPHRHPTSSAAAGVPASNPLTLLNGTLPRPPLEEPINLAGVTTRPHDCELEPPTVVSVSTPQPRRLENVELSEKDVESLTASYYAYYHGYLPILDPDQPPHMIYESSAILFWCIMSVAARRSDDHPTLLNQLARPVTDLLWRNIRTPPHTLGVVQAILVLCLWPFPTSSSTMDQSYNLASLAISISIQMGLHRPINQHDYVKYRFHLSDDEVNQRIKTWTACNIVAHNASVGVGLQTASRLEDCPNSLGGSPGASTASPDPIHSMLHIERLKKRISSSFTANMTDRLMLRPFEERLPFYTTFLEELSALRAKVGPISPYVGLQLLAAQLHLEAFFLSDDPNVPGYDDRILSLHSTVIQYNQQVLNMDATTSLTQYGPYSIYQTFSSACFILLKILRNNYFSSLIDFTGSQKLFNRSISAMRRMSVSNNDVPGRVSDVLTYLWNLSDHTVIGGHGQAGLKLNIRSRMSMSVVYDSLWRWRDQFRAAAAGIEAPESREDSQELGDDFDNSAFLGFADLPADDLFWDWFR